VASADPEYAKAVEIFERVLDGMIMVSKASAGRRAEHRVGWASVIFTRLCLMGTTLDRILPYSRVGPNEGHIWDYSSIASLIRSIVECCLLFHYLSIEKVGEDEARDRINLMHLHDCTARQEMLRTLFGDAEEAAKFDGQRAELVERLRTSPWFGALSEKRQAILLKGDHMSFQIQDETLESMGKDVAEFRAWWRVLSAHVHSYALAFHRALTDSRGRGVENEIEKRWATVTLEFMTPFLGQALSGMLTLFPDVPDPRLPPRRSAPRFV
jgi:hypothetical protein